VKFESECSICCCPPSADRAGLTPDFLLTSDLVCCRPDDAILPAVTKTGSYIRNRITFSPDISSIYFIHLYSPFPFVYCLLGKTSCWQKYGSTDFGDGVTYNGWRMEYEQNRHSTGFKRDHARLVDRASPGSGMTISGKTSSQVESHGKRHFSWRPTEMNGEVGLPNVLDTGYGLRSKVFPNIYIA